MTTPAHTPAPFGEIHSLLAAFAETKKLRRGRQPAHVLVVEDDPLTRRLVTGAFKSDYAMITATGAQEAVADYLLHAPDVVFLDIGLPDADGFAVLEQIIAVDPDAFVVMFSSHCDARSIERAYAAGAKAFVAKPFRKEALASCIRGSAIHYRKSPA